MQPLKLKQKSDDSDRIIIALEGKIVEGSTAVFKKLELANGVPVCLDFADVYAINSVGSVEWMNFIDMFAANHKVETINMHYEIARTLRLIPSVMRASSIQSVVIDCCCIDCDHEVSLTFDIVDRAKLGEFFNQSRSCQKCGSEMELSVLKEEFEAIFQAA